jgi:hypothetical protein
MPAARLPLDDARMKGWILGLSLQLLATPLLAGEVTAVIGPVEQIEVLEIGQGPNTAVDNCQEYSVTAEEVADFLRHAIVITQRQEHDWYLRPLLRQWHADQSLRPMALAAAQHGHRLADGRHRRDLRAR